MCMEHDCAHQPQARPAPGLSRRAFLQFAAGGVYDLASGRVAPVAI